MASQPESWSPSLEAWPAAVTPSTVASLVQNVLQTQQFDGTLKLLVMRERPSPQQPQQGLLLLGATSGTG